MSEINFRTIRSHDRSQANAFEELCCQLAALEPPSTGATFIRKRGGGGDAGVECYWRLPDGSEHCWQAKYFFKLGDSEWGQIDGSIKTALDKHPRLTRYVICVAMDRTDQKKKGQKSDLDKWDTHVKKWKKWAAKKDMSVEFEWWGSAEIIERLCRDDPLYSGRARYWFDDQWLSSKWFQDRFENSKAQLGHRYIPDFHVDLPIGEILEAIADDDKFRGRLEADFRSFFREFGRYHRIPEAPGEGRTLYETLLGKVEALKPLAHSAISTAMHFDVNLLRAAIRELIEAFSAFRSWCWEEKHDPPSENSLEDLEDRVKEISLDAYKKRVLLVHGDAGVGKSHLLAHATALRLKSNFPTVLLLGQQFSDAPLWTTVRALLDLPGDLTLEEFLGALDAAAEARDSRAMILIDAVNESRPWRIWKDQLNSFVASVRKFGRIALVLSCRETLIGHIFGSDDESPEIVRIVHDGFAGFEATAAMLYLQHRGFDRPTTPLMTPEFANPLFLKTICDALDHTGSKVFPRGLRGASAVRRYYLESLQKVLENQMNLEPTSRTAQQVLEILAGEMLKAKDTWLSRQLVDELLKPLADVEPGWTNSLLFHLIDEGVLSEDYFFPAGPDSEFENIIRFTFERQADHFIAERMIEAIGTQFEPEHLFSEGGVLNSALDRPTWLEALAIQLPETKGIELPDAIAKDRRHWPDVTTAFVESLLWRDRAKFTDRTWDLFNELKSSGWYIRMDILVKVSTEPDHPWNAERLDRWLARMDMAKRDSVWSAYIGEQYGHLWHAGDCPIEVLISWAWEADKTWLEDDRAWLTALVLSWFLTTTHREARDCATKALASIFLSSPTIAVRVLQHFQTVDDLYVRERQMAAALGAACNGLPDANLSDLARWVYETEFASKKPTPHLLLRDYARSIVELANHRGLLSEEATIDKARPPYQSPWPIENPGVQEIEELSKKTKAIALSVSSFLGDFGIYTMRCVKDWSATPFTEPAPRTGQDFSEEFMSGLTTDQREALDSLLKAQSALQKETDRARTGPIEFDRTPTSGEQRARKKLDEGEVQFRDTLDDAQREVFRWLFKYNPGSPARVVGGDKPVAFSRKWAQRWLVKRCIEFGWTEKLLGEIDRTIASYHDRRRPSVERIGKKYQRIAFFELLARMADNLYFLGSSYSDEVHTYRGPWQILRRDIDPTWLQPKGKAKTVAEEWWVPPEPNWENLSLRAKANWVTSLSDLPKFPDFLVIEEPVNSKRWIILDGFVDGNDGADVFDEETPRRELWWRVHSRIVHRNDLTSFVDDLKTKHLEDPSILGDHFFGFSDRFFLGERTWHPEATRLTAVWNNEHGFSVKVAATTEPWSWEAGQSDASLGKQASVTFPGPVFAEGLGISMELRNGAVRFVDPSDQELWHPVGRMLAYDAVANFLQKNDLVLVWGLGGEKTLIAHRVLKTTGQFIFNDVAWWDGLKFDHTFWSRTETPVPEHLLEIGADDGAGAIS